MDQYAVSWTLPSLFKKNEKKLLHLLPWIMDTYKYSLAHIIIFFWRSIQKAIYNTQYLYLHKNLVFLTYPQYLYGRLIVNGSRPSGFRKFSLYYKLCRFITIQDKLKDWYKFYRSTNNREICSILRNVALYCNINDSK